MFYVDVFNVLFSEDAYKTLVRDLNVYASKKYKTKDIKPSLLCPRKECKHTKQIADHRYYCNSCKKEFSPFTGTIFDGVKLSFPKIIGAIYLYDIYKKENKKSRSQNIKLTPQSLAGFLDISKESARQLLGKINLVMSYTNYSSDERIERYSSLNRKTTTTERFDFKKNNKILKVIIKTFETNEEIVKFTDTISKKKNFGVFIWAGSKRSIRKSIIDRMPRDIENFYEPFCGGGNVVFSLLDLLIKMFNARGNGKVVISDYNENIINLYKDIRDDLDSLLHHLKSYQKLYNKSDNKRDSFKKIKRSFNNDPLPRVEKSAMFIFLTGTCFYGATSFSDDSEFMSNFGKVKFTYKTDKIITLNKLLNNERVELRYSSYEAIENNLQEGDFIYLDPPYDDQSIERIGYAGGFDETKQIELKDFLIRIHKKGVRFLASNFDNNFIRTIYSDDSVFQIDTIYVKRTIRGIVTIDKEALISSTPFPLRVKCESENVVDVQDDVLYKSKHEDVSNLISFHGSNNTDRDGRVLRRVVGH